MNRFLLSLASALFPLWGSGAVKVDGVHTDTDAAYGDAVSDSDLVNAGSPSLALPPVYSSDPFSDPAANNDGTVGTAADTGDITFWLGAAAGDQFTITYRLDTSFSPLGFDITSIQTIHGWTNASGNQKNRTYTLTAALGVRREPGNFGGARLEILANGEVVARASFDKPALDELRSGDSSGTFTEATVSWSTGAAVSPGQPLAIKIAKQEGPGTVLDFDHVRFTSPPTRDFGSWIDTPEFGLDPTRQGFSDDPDLDGFPSGLEAWFGSNPGQFDPGLAVTPGIAQSLTFTHPRKASRDLNGRPFWRVLASPPSIIEAVGAFFSG